MAGIKTNSPYKRSTSHRTPWSYRAGTTPLYRCPAGLKLLLLLLLSAAPVLGLPFAGGAALLILIGAISARLKITELFTGSKALVLILLVFSVLRAIHIDTGQSQSILNPVQFRLNLGFLHCILDLPTLLNGLYLGTGILICFSVASLFFAVTTTTEIRKTLAGMEFFLFRRQSRLSLALALMLGFLPRFFECWENANLAAKARCCKGGLKRVMVILPLVTERMIHTAAETAEALEARGLK